MVHNGVIWNDYEVAKEQDRGGINYISQQKDGRYNDSEVLLYDLADVFEGKKDSLSVEGSIAFVVIKLDKKGNRKSLLFGRNSGSPLKIMKYRHGFSITSEGEGVDVEPNKLFEYDYKTGKFSSKPMKIPYYTASDWSTYNQKYSFQSGSRNSLWDDDDEYSNLPVWRDKETGMGYDNRGNKIDQNGYLIPDVSKCEVFTEKVLDRYKDAYNTGAGEDKDFTQAVNEVKNALLYDMLYNTEQAVEFAEYMYVEMEERYEELDALIESGDTGTTGNEFDEYLVLDIQMALLKKAIETLRGDQLKFALTTGLNTRKRLTA